MTNTIEVLGLGNTLVDIIAHADDAYLDAQDMVKGAMTLIDEDRAEALYAARRRSDHRQRRFGRQHDRRRRIVRRAAAYIGKVKRDPLGESVQSPISARPA